MWQRRLGLLRLRSGPVAVRALRLHQTPSHNCSSPLSSLLVASSSTSSSVGSESKGVSFSDLFPVANQTQTQTRAETSAEAKTRPERVSLTGIVHKIWRRAYQSGDVLVDATLGKGRDTIELARLANLLSSSSSSSAGVRLVGFDIQAEAVEMTRENLRGEFTSDETSGKRAEMERQVALFQCSHSELSARLAGCGVKEGQVGIICFNLGYLPGGCDGKHVITTGASTLEALGQSLCFLRPGGLVSLLCYVGHQGGREEHRDIKNFTSELVRERPATWEVHEYDPKEMAPKIIILVKKQ